MRKSNQRESFILLKVIWNREVSQKLLCAIIYSKQKSQRAAAALAIQTRTGCGCLGLDQCAHPVWLLTLSLAAASLFTVLTSIHQEPLLTTSETELMISLSVKSSGK